MDPLHYEFGKYVFDSGEIHGTVIMRNVICQGLTEISFPAVKPHFLDDAFRLEIETRVPKLVNDGDCEAEGRVGEFKMGGKGHFNVTLEDIRGTMDLIGHVANDTWTVEHFRYRPSIGSLKIYLNNLFNGSKELNDLAMFFVNEYWPAFYRTMLPVASERWDPWLTGLSNRLFSKVSFSKLFP